MKKLLEKLANFTHDHPWWVWAGAIVLSLALLPGLFRIKINNDYSEMLPPTSQALKDLHRLSDELDGLGDFMVLLEGAPIEDLVRFADEILAGLPEDPLIRRARYKTETDYFEDRKFLYMPYEDLREMVTAMRRKVSEEKLKASPFGLDLGVETKADLTLKEIKRKHEVDEWFSYFTDPDRKSLLVLISPRAFPDDVGAAQKLKKIADVAVAKAKASPVGQELGSRIDVHYGGPYFELLYENDVLQQDIPRGGMLTAALIILLILIVYRSGWAVVALLLPLGLTILWSFSLAGFIFTEGLNSMSSFLGMILFGLGIDFGIHIVNRFGEECRAGHDADQSLRHTVTETGESSFFAAATSAAAFFVLMTAHFRGYTQFGLFAGISVIIAFMGIIVLLPAMLTILHRHGWAVFCVEEKSGAQVLRWMACWPVRHVGIVLSLAIIATAAFSWYAVHFRISYDVSEFRPTSEFAEHVNKVARAALDFEGVPAIYILDSEEKVRDVTAAIRKADEENFEHSVILDTRSILDLIPEREEEKRHLLERLDRTLQREINLAGDDPENAEDVRELRDLQDEIAMPSFSKAELPLSVVTDLYRPEKNRFFVYLFTNHENYEGPNFALAFGDVFGEVRGELGTYRATGPLMIENEILHHLLTEGPDVMMLALIAVAILVVLLLRTFFHSSLALLTLTVGFIWAAGVAVLAGESINVFNIVTVPAILGLSVDYGIHLIHRYQQWGPGSLRIVMEHTGRSVWLSALTTIFGFAGLLPSHHAGLRSLGLLAIIGIGAGMLAVTFVFPVLASVVGRRVPPPPPHGEDEPPGPPEYIQELEDMEIHDRHGQEGEKSA